MSRSRRRSSCRTGRRRTRRRRCEPKRSRSTSSFPLRIGIVGRAFRNRIESCLKRHVAVCRGVEGTSGSRWLHLDWRRCQGCFGSEDRLLLLCNVNSDFVVKASEEATRWKSEVEWVVTARLRYSLIDFESDVLVLRNWFSDFLTRSDWQIREIGSVRKSRLDTTSSDGDRFRVDTTQDENRLRSKIQKSA